MLIYIDIMKVRFETQAQTQDHFLHRFFQVSVFAVNDQNVPDAGKFSSIRNNQYRAIYLRNNFGCL